MATTNKRSRKDGRPFPFDFRSARKWARVAGTSPLERALNIVSIAAILILIVVVVLWRIPSPYQILLPATAQRVDPKIQVAGHPPASGRGQFYMTFVSEPDSNMLQEIFGRLNPDATLVQRQQGVTQSQEQAANAAMMLSSTQTAELVALCHIGYAKLCSSGVQVTAIALYSKAGTMLKVNDVIVAVDGKAVVTPDQLRAALNARPAGSTFDVQVRRTGKDLTLKLMSVASPNEPGRAVLGIAVAPAPPPSIPSTLPIDMKIDPGDIGGPSAGLMFTLGLLSRLSPTDLTKGYCVAGTGTIDLSGAVGAIGGVKQKVIGAQWAHARYFFVPYDQGNYSDAQKVVGKSMTLVPVHTLDDALAFLAKLPTAQKLCN
jgi:PDZ domain-containing protein